MITNPRPDFFYDTLYRVECDFLNKINDLCTVINFLEECHSAKEILVNHPHYEMAILPIIDNITFPCTSEVAQKTIETLKETAKKNPKELLEYIKSFQSSQIRELEMFAECWNSGVENIDLLERHKYVVDAANKRKLRNLLATAKDCLECLKYLTKLACIDSYESNLVILKCKKTLDDVQALCKKIGITLDICYSQILSDIEKALKDPTNAQKILQLHIQDVVATIASFIY